MTLIHLPEPSAKPSAKPPSRSRLTVEAPFHLEATVRLLARRPTKVAAIALANKLARMAWAMMAKGGSYKEPAALAV